MPWQAHSSMTLRSEFVQVAQHDAANLSSLCRQVGSRRKTGDTWLGRYHAQGPATAPRQTPADLAALDRWLIRLGVSRGHGRAYHPQTQDKVERAHATIQPEVGDTSRFPDLGHCQIACDAWRATCNLMRPHDSLNLDVPASRSQPSPRSFPAVLPPIVYRPDDAGRQVNTQGESSFRNRRHCIGRGMAGEAVAVLPTQEEEVYRVYSGHQHLATIAHDETLAV
jgi:hypothetical protein